MNELIIVWIHILQTQHSLLFIGMSVDNDKSIQYDIKETN
jgi:hypothetical protein